MKNASGEIYWPQYSQNSIDYFKIDEAYQIKMPNNGPFYFNARGKMICPSEVEFNLIGWRFVPYLRKSSINVKTELENQVPNISSYIEVVKSSSGAIYWPLYSMNMIGNFIPGEGYQFKFTNSISWHYSNNEDLLGTKNDEFCAELFNGIDNSDIITDVSMTLGIPIECWDFVPENGDIIIAKGEAGQTVGRTVFCGQFTAMTIYGDDTYTTDFTEGLHEGESFSLEILQTGSNKTIRDVISLKQWAAGDGYYKKNKISLLKKESNDEGFEGNKFLATVFPNPSDGGFTIKAFSKYFLDTDITIFNSIGEVIFVANWNLVKGENLLFIDLESIEAGIYFCRFDVNNQYIKLIVN